MADVQPLKFGPLGDPQQCGAGDTLPRAVLPAATVYSDAVQTWTGYQIYVGGGIQIGPASACVRVSETGVLGSSPTAGAGPLLLATDNNSVVAIRAHNSVVQIGTGANNTLNYWNFDGTRRLVASLASSTGVARQVAMIVPSWADSTDATRLGRLDLAAWAAGTSYVGIRVEAAATAARVGFYGSAAVARPTVSGSRMSGAALVSLLSALSSLGLVTDSTSS